MTRQLCCSWRSATWRLGFAMLLLSALLATSNSCCYGSKPVPNDWSKLFDEFCIHCHDTGSETGLDLGALNFELANTEVFRDWERIYDRIAAGEMPPISESQPDDKLLERNQALLYQHLNEASLSRQQQYGRVPSRRLTKLELDFTLRDLLAIKKQVTADVPAEVETGSFDTVGAYQRISAVHMEKYLAAADLALAEAIQLGSNPMRVQKLDYRDSAYLNEFHDKPLNLGGSISRRTERGVALFRDVDYLLTSYAGGFSVRKPGTYRIETQVAAYQSLQPVTYKLLLKEASGGTRLLFAKDLLPGEDRTVTAECYLQPGDMFYVTFHMLEEPFVALLSSGVQNYRGPGIELLSQQVSGPLNATWPPPSTRQLLGDREIFSDEAGHYQPVPPKDDQLTLQRILRQFAPRAFRRPVTEDELNGFCQLADAALASQHSFLDALRIALRSMLSSPQFLMFDGAPGPLDDYALANRLSYFLWRSLPDAQLYELAARGRLHDPKVLRSQVDRLLADPKSERFVRDFIGQWLRIHKVNATSPDSGLYPEFDELLSDAIPRESEEFFAALIKRNLPIHNLVASNFTFVNRRLAEHYGITGVEGQEFREVKLAENSVRGGILTQAAILKTTANGTTTSPVMRGNFVLTNFLGTPPASPPPNVGSIEPDTRGTTTIREMLVAHRKIDSCNQCHAEIDPPGFALESFDPIGGFRTHYRASGKPSGIFSVFSQATYHRGPPVDPSGQLSDGGTFSDIQEFKQLMLQKEEQIARNLIRQLVVYGTGGEIQFADRQAIESILNATRGNGYRLQDILHAVVQSRLFTYL